MHPLMQALCGHTWKNTMESNKCNHCDYATSHAGSLKTHMKTHTAEKSNECSLCNYASSRADSLRTHMKKHTGEKSNKCSLCDYASSQAGDLRRHKKKTHWRIVKQWCREFEDTYQKTQRKTFLIDMFNLCNDSNKRLTMRKKQRVGWRMLQNLLLFCVLALGAHWTTYQCQPLKFIMNGGNLTLTHSHLFHYWHFPTMVGICHGGNMPASHNDNDDDRNDDDDGL